MPCATRDESVGSAKPYAIEELKKHGSYLRYVLAVAVNSTSHQIMMTTKIFSSGIIYDVCAQFKRALQERAHHSIVDDDDSFWYMSMNHVGDGFDVDYLKERIGR